MGEAGVGVCLWLQRMGTSRAVIGALGGGQVRGGSAIA